MKHNYKHDEDMIFNMIDLFEKKQLSVEKKNVMFKSISDLCDRQYSVYCNISKNRQHRNALYKYDKMLSAHNDFYIQNRGKPIYYMVRTGYPGYLFFTILKAYRNKKYSKGIYKSLYD